MIRPDIGGNIGAIARAMKNLGFEDLVIVDGCELDEEAHNRAKHAQEILNSAERWDRMKWSGFDLTVGTSSETGGGYNVRRNAITPGKLGQRLKDVEGEVGLIFGPEAKGLRNEEVEKCDLLCHIPANDEYPVFNLSHAATIILYELSKAGKDAAYKLANEDQKRVLMEQLEGLVDEVTREYRRGPVELSLKNVFGRGMLSTREANTLIGFFRKIKERLKKQQSLKG